MAKPRTNEGDLRINLANRPGSAKPDQNGSIPEENKSNERYNLILEYRLALQALSKYDIKIPVPTERYRRPVFTGLEEVLMGRPAYEELSIPA
ncbi:MAG: hypothetical protein V4587_16175 [Acidobacteriota bacterium]